jgi:hypothetical protein
MRASFEEKTYEAYFNNELNSRSDIYFPLGQVQEGVIGADSAAYSVDRRLWKQFKHPFWFHPSFSGEDFNKIAKVMEDHLNNELRGIPQIKVNLLFQYKRPYFLNSAFAVEWIYWNSPYYKYHINQDQQNLLMQIYNQFGSQVFILYAAPAIHEVADLVEMHRKKQIIKNSNFRQASELNNHRKNTYNRAGLYSIAFSEPERFDNFDLDEVLQQFDSSNDLIFNSRDNNKIFIDFKDTIVSIVNNNQQFASSFNKLNLRFIDLQKYELFYSHLIMSNFRILTGIQWLIKF